MQKARTEKIIAITLALSCLTAALITPSEVRAAVGGVQTCTASATCVVGEFLFDDSSAPISGASCTITSSNPDHTSYLSAEPLSGGGADGWYYHEFTAPAVTGYYSTLISCTVDGDTLSIDKSFEVVSTATSGDPDSVASAVWNYSTRTVTSFGSLISDIWNSATRTLTGAGLGSGQLATQDDVISVRNNIASLSNDSSDLAQIKETTEQTRLLLEQVVNKPIIENVLEQSIPGIGEKLEGTRAQANQLYVNNQFLTDKTANLASSWNSMSGKETLDAVLAISEVIGESGDSSSRNTMFGQANWVKDSWTWSQGDSIYNQLTSIQSKISDLKIGLANYQKNTALYNEVKSLVKDSVALEKVIGTVSDSKTSGTLFAKIKETSDLAANLEDKETQINNVLGAYTKSKDISLFTSKISDLQNQVIALNKVPGVVSAITKINPSDTNSVTNNLLSLKGIVDSNMKLLSLGSGQTMVNVWLEVGSIIFKTVATNPSSLISQKVDVKYYLPPELKQDDILKTDAGLTVNYDAEKDQLYVEGEFDLGPNQTRTFSVETKDIWSYQESQIDSLRNQADELFAPLQKTAYYAQGVSLRSDINANLDQILSLQGAAITPEDKIKAYRENEILMKSVNEKLAGLKDLVTQAGATGSLFGFVGGSQTIAVWGIVIIVVAGFILMTVFMRNASKKGKTKKVEIPVEGAKIEIKAQETKSGKGGKIGVLKLLSVVVISSAISATGSGFIVSKIVSGIYEQKLSVLGTETSAPQATSETQSVESVPGQGGQDIVKIVVPYGEEVTLYKNVGETALPETLSTSLNALRLDEKAGYVQVISQSSSMQNELSGVWIDENFVKDGEDLPDDSNIMEGNLVLIDETPTGWLRVRDSAGTLGNEIDKVKPGEEYLLVSQDADWYQIVLKDGSFGWISGQYSSEE